VKKQQAQEFSADVACAANYSYSQLFFHLVSG